MLHRWVLWLLIGWCPVARKGISQSSGIFSWMAMVPPVAECLLRFVCAIKVLTYIAWFLISGCLATWWPCVSGAEHWCRVLSRGLALVILGPVGLKHCLGHIEAKQQCIFTCIERRSSFNNSKGMNERSAVHAAWTLLNELELKGHVLEPRWIPEFEHFE